MNSSLTVLGSGGPMHGGGRGNSAYLLQEGTRPLLVVDMGGDTPTAMARAGIMAGTVPILAITHMHPDHVSGIPDYIWGEIQAGRTSELVVISPPAAPKYRSADQLFAKLFGSDGAFPDMSDVLAGKPFPIRFKTASGNGEIVHSDAGMVIRATKVVHGDLPALAYRIDTSGRSIVLAGDQDMEEPGMTAFARDADLMVAHAIGDEGSAASWLKHIAAMPSSIGRIARDANVRHLVLSHWLEAPGGAPNAQSWSLPHAASILAQVRHEFGGPTDMAHDLARYDVGARASN